jgi:hypothetical protein
LKNKPTCYAEAVRYREASEQDKRGGLERRYKLGQIETNAAKLPGERAKAFQEVLKPYSFCGV